jgi:hypothetical protein
MSQLLKGPDVDFRQFLDGSTIFFFNHKRGIIFIRNDA